MLDEADLRRGSALRERRRVILLCAPVTLLFTFADTVALHRFSPAVFGVRLLWTAQIAATGLLLGRVSAVAERRMTLLLAVCSSLFFGLLTTMTGGFASPLFHWILAMPLVIAVVLQEYPRATSAAAVATLASGLAIVIHSGQSVQIALEWLIQAAGMSALAVYASVAYRRLRFREQALREAAAVAGERMRASEEAVRQRDDFLTVAAHELRTPLTSVRLHAERLMRRPGETTGLTSLYRQLERLTSLVETLLDMSRLASGQLDLRPSPTPLRPLLRQLLARQAPVAADQECSLTLEDGEDLSADVDRTRLEQVVTNLITNATKYGRGQPVVVSLARGGAGLRIAVRDRGIGIAAEDQRRIFERFERAASSSNYGGVGLVLWISKRLVEAMGGSITVDSRPDQGATFTVELPLAAAPRVERPAAL
jgi:signal transduction histidine kinase